MSALLAAMSKQFPGFLHSIRIARCFFLAAGAFACFIALLSLGTSSLYSQTIKYAKPPDAKNGERIYKGGCIACHGAEGKGAPETSTEFTRPDTFPDFTDCASSAPTSTGHVES